MVEPEMAYADLNDVMALAEGLVVSVVARVLDTRRRELTVLERDTRKLEKSPRWELAASDNQISHKALLGDFGCAAGLDLAAVDAPALARVLLRSSADLFPVVGAAKDAYKRPRPYSEQQGPLCIVPSEELTESGSYPSGHAATGWLYALLLA